MQQELPDKRIANISDSEISNNPKLPNLLMERDLRYLSYLF